MRVGLLMTSHCTAFTQHFIAAEVNTEQVNAATSKRINPGVKLGYSRQSYVEHIKKTKCLLLRSKYTPRTRRTLSPEIPPISQIRGNIACHDLQSISMAFHCQ